ncbi:MAG: hypothetical protein AB1505_23715 [Candidatus Latescibacterota bacterium]
MYDLVQQGQVTYRLVLLRHDIACGHCRDILAVALYDLRQAALARVLLVEPFESEKGQVDAGAFLAQMVGRSLQAPLAVGQNVDGITQATNSAVGLVERLNEAAAWLREHPPADVVVTSSSGGGSHDQ